MDNAMDDNQNDTPSAISNTEQQHPDINLQVPNSLALGSRDASSPAIHSILVNNNTSAQNNSNVQEWNNNDVCTWLVKIGYTDIVQLFKNSNVTGTMLLGMTDETLHTQVKLNSPVMRASLLDEISILKRSISNSNKHALHDTNESDQSWEMTLNSVIKIFCTSTTPNYAQPWQMKRQCTSTSSGFVIKGNRIVGNAHGVTNSSSIRVRKHGDAKKYPAYIIANAHECDLVMLGVHDPQFWTGLEAMELGGIPRLHESVTVVGYPQGGDNISVTKGVVSRVIVSTYSHSGESLLSIQIDAAINSGNSGGPVVQNSRVVGVAFEAMTQAQNIGYIIPIPVLKHFITDYDKNQCYTGFPRVGFSWQKLENESLRHYYKVPDTKHGVVVSSVEPLDSAAGKLQRDDVLIAVDGIPLADDGTIFFRRGERVSFRYLETTKYIGDSITLTVIRNGIEQDVTFTLESRKPLVPLHLHDRLPSYFVIAGLVFTVLSRAYLFHEYGKDWHKKAPVELVEQAYYGQLDRTDRQIVILSQILVDDVNSGYGSMFHNLRVLDINGVSIINLAQLVDTIERLQSDNQPFLRVNLDRDKMLVLDIPQATAANEDILRQNNISVDRSPDLLGKPPLWSHRPITPRFKAMPVDHIAFKNEQPMHDDKENSPMKQFAQSKV